MSSTVALRSGKDRLRYTFTFEMTLLMLLIPAGAVFFDKPLEQIGLLGLILAIKAMAINLIYNWLFDRMDARLGRVSSQRSHLGRVFHAIGFELTLLTTSMPIYVWWLQITLLEAFVTDLVVTSFVVAYTYVFTLGYDKTFPLPVRTT